MSEIETKQERILKRTQIWVAVLAGLVTFIVGAYNVKGLLFSKKGPGSVTVSVSTDQGPASQASLEILKVQGGIITSSSSGSDGKYEHKKLEPGNYSLKVSKPNFQGETLFFTIDPGQTTHLDLKLKPVSSSIRSTVEEVGSSWLKKIGTPKEKSPTTPAPSTP